MTLILFRSSLSSFIESAERWAQVTNPRLYQFWEHLFFFVFWAYYLEGLSQDVCLNSQQWLAVFDLNAQSVLGYSTLFPTQSVAVLLVKGRVFQSRRRASGLARPPLDGRWLQRVEARTFKQIRMDSHCVPDGMSGSGNFWIFFLGNSWYAGMRSGVQTQALSELHWEGPVASTELLFFDSLKFI